MKRSPRGDRLKADSASQLSPGNLRPIARDLAFAVLCEYRRSGAFVSQLLDERFRALHPDPQERPLATELAAGVVRRQSTIDLLLEPHLRRPRSNVEPDLWTLLQLGAYQLAFLTAMPPHAAVHETVEVARRFGRDGWCGFANGILRGVERSLTDEMTESPGANALPLTGGSFRKLLQPRFPPPDANLPEYISAAFSFPRWLIERWPAQDRTNLLRMAFWFNTPALPALRVNLLRTTREAMLSRLQAEGVSAECGDVEESIRLKQPVRIESLAGFLEGHVTVQDESAMSAAHQLDPRPGERILDLCAAPGTKTTHLAERMQNTGRIVACDIDALRLQRVTQNAKRLGLTMIETRTVSEHLADVPEGPFDAVLLDVPCTNTGVLGKRPEARWRLTPADIGELAAIQSRLLEIAAARLKPEGRILYSTCSIEPEENEQQVRRFLARRPEFTLQGERFHLPGMPGDGGYQAWLHAK